MAQNPGDDKTEPSLELPTLKLPALGRRRKRAAATGTDPAPSNDETVGASATERTASTLAPEPASEHPPAPAEPAPARSRLATRPTSRSVKAPGTRRAVPKISGPPAAALTGVLVALSGGAATYAALAGCEAVRGVSTCGGTPGFLILLAIVALMILLGSALLRAFGVADPGSTSFLAVGIVTVVAMLTLLDVMSSPWMFVVIPALSAVAFLVAHWVNTRFADEPTGRRDWT